jgi:phenol 2-monooxygenase
MNVSMADAWNLGWKLASVLRGTARPELLHSYSEERQSIAQELIDFDREFSRLFSGRRAKSGDGDSGPVDPEEFQAYFIAQGRFTAGVATRYEPSMITAHARFQDLAEGFPVGMRFHSAPVVRVADAKPVHLGHVARADGAWRIYMFADRNDPNEADSRARELCEFLASDASPLNRFTPAGAEVDSVIDVRAIFQQSHRELVVNELPTVLLPRKGMFALIDYEKAFCPDPNADDIFETRSVNREAGCMIIVRPDQYVASVLPLDAHEALVSFFAGILIDAR